MANQSAAFFVTDLKYHTMQPVLSTKPVKEAMCPNPLLRESGSRSGCTPREGFSRRAWLSEEDKHPSPAVGLDEPIGQDVRRAWCTRGRELSPAADERSLVEGGRPFFERTRGPGRHQASHCQLPRDDVSSEFPLPGLEGWQQRQP